ncbi:MAG TPA: M28 family peptidase [Chloroflexota bacterium]|jgi:Iap family predicted aminopeptidase|nr:M28 family peptidase [Chloroflexota bacterium]
MRIADGTAAADAALCGDLWRGDGGWSVLTELVDTCHGRFAGTTDERRAADLLLATFQRYGLQNAHEEAFTYAGWRRGAPPLLRIVGNGQEIASFSLPGSPSATIEGGLVDLGCATDEDLERAGADLTGKIALISAATPPRAKAMHRDEKVARAARRGAVGVLWMRDAPGQLGETGGLFFHDAPPIPGLAVTREDGLRLARLLQQGEAIRLAAETHDTPRQMTSWNIVGELPGSEAPDDVVLIGAHYDGHDIAEAALDNGSGVAAMVEAARGLALQRGTLCRTVRFIAFGVEELGLYGAYAYAAAHQAEFDNLRLMFNLDTIAEPGATKGVSTQCRPRLRAALEDIGRAMGEPFPVDDHLSMYSDQFPFVLKGAPAAVLTSPDVPRTGGRGVGHTTADTLDKVHRLSLKLSALFTARFALHVANAADWPAQRWSDDETRQELEAAGARASMEMEGIWPWPSSAPSSER